ncbi:MAG: hypothetical protein LBU30_06115 [Candidatus Methanoplasma sp.]|jgi:hypothetical protein|nr:hypothetical protein [Candidatus Methanoplasma sp.]
MELKIKLAAVAVFAILVSISFYSGAWHLIPLAVAVTFAFTAPFMGDSDGNASGKSRVKGLYLSFLPGLGHTYLGRARSSVPYVSVFVISVFVFSLAVPFTEDVVYLIMLFATTYFSAAMVAAVEIEAVCDELGIPHEDGSAEMNIQNRPRAYMLSVIMPYSLLFIIAVFCWVRDTIHTVPIYVVSLLLWTAVAAVSASWYLRSGNKQGRIGKRVPNDSEG